MSQGNCTLCKHCHLQTQLGQTQRVCRKGPPSVIVLPQSRGQAAVVSVWPAVGEAVVCDAFEAQPLETH